METRVTDLDSYVKGKTRVLPNGCHQWMGKLSWQGRAVFPESIRERFEVSVMVSRYVLGQVTTCPDAKLKSIHSCDNPSCINPGHLSWETQGFNLQDMTQKGRRAYGDKLSSKGEKNPMAKLTEEQVKWVLSTELTGRKKARVLGVSEVMISRIMNHKSWRHLHA